MNTLIKPTADIFVLYLLGSEKNKDLLLSFINAVLIDSAFPPVKEVTLKNPFNLKTFRVDKETILDVKALDENNNQYDIEIQASYDASFPARSLFYWAKFYTSQLNEGMDYFDLKPTICINLLDFNLLEDDNQIHSCFMLQEKNNPEMVLSDHIILHFIEIKKFKTKIKEMSPELYDWIYYFKYEGEDEKMKLVIDKNKMIQKADQEYKKFNEDDHLREIAESRLKYRLDTQTFIKSAELRGKKEEKIETALKMLQKKYDVHAIVELTGLPINEIERLAIKLNQKSNES
ncbi:MAG TPA: hypothetical protein DHW82_06385 [Spirochaetia bacterium]|nr:hypothetical protein [Spirochaetia bacterium]